MEYSEEFIKLLEEVMEGGTSAGHHSLVVAACELHNLPIISWCTALEILCENDSDLQECADCGEVFEGLCTECENGN